MASFKSELIRFIMKNRHLLKGQIKKPVIDFSTSIEDMRADISRTAQKMAKIPEDIIILQAEFKDFYAEWVIPKNCNDDKVILYFHGGGFVSGTSKDHRALVSKFSKRCGVKSLVFDYSLAPEHPFPAAILDSIAIYNWLLDSGYLPENIVFAGDSAGGGIEMSTLVMLRDKKLPLPAAVVAMSPCTDLTCSGESHKTRIKADPCTPKGANETYTSYYIGKGDPHDPYMSPLFADLTDLPPMMIQVGEDETLLDDSVRFAKKAKESGVEANIHVWKRMFHCFPMLAPMFPEATKAMDEISYFIREKLLLK